jgi:HAMP domain-containing protein
MVSALRKALGAASLRTRVLIATCLVVAAALAIMGFAGTFLLRTYLISRDDAQLRAFAQFTAKSHALPPRPLPSRPPRPGDTPLPSAFLIEIVSRGGSVEDVVRTGFHGQDQAPAPRLAASELRVTTTPFTVQTGSHAWRVMVQTLPGHRYGVVALSLDNILPVVGQLALIELLAGLIALVLLMVTGFWLIRASLAPLSDIERTAESIAARDLSRRVPDYRPRADAPVCRRRRPRTPDTTDVHPRVRRLPRPAGGRRRPGRNQPADEPHPPGSHPYGQPRRRPAAAGPSRRTAGAVAPVVHRHGPRRRRAGQAGLPALLHMAGSHRDRRCQRQPARGTAVTAGTPDPRPAYQIHFDGRAEPPRPRSPPRRREPPSTRKKEAQ